MEFNMRGALRYQIQEQPVRFRDALMRRMNGLVKGEKHEGGTDKIYMSE